MRIVGMGYPGPFRTLRDIALAASPLASATLLGTEVSPAVLRGRLRGVTRAWVVTGASHHRFPALTSAMGRAEAALLRHLRLLRRWHAGGVMLSLFGPL